MISNRSYFSRSSVPAGSTEEATTRAATSRTALRRLATALTCTTLVAGAALFAVPATAFAADDANPVLVAQDSFNRADTVGLGSADIGGSYYFQDSAVRIAGNAAQLTLAAGRSTEAALNVSSANIRAQVAVSFPASAGTTDAGIVLREEPDGSEYRARITNTNGHIALAITRQTGSAAEVVLSQLQTGIVLAAGQTLNVQGQVSGSKTVSLSARVWVSGTTMPDWQINAADTSASRLSLVGMTGLYERTAAGNTTTAIASFDDLSVWTVTVPEAVVPPVVVVPPIKTPSGATQPAQGSFAVGAASYAIPSGALYVDPTNGNDAATGTVTTPLKTAAKAITKVAANGTIVLRAGTYHEQISTSKSNFTIQSAPGEAVWFDGSRAVTAWTRTANGWTTPWTTQFDNSVSYTKGDHAAPGNNGWLFVNPSYPMAAWPDQAFVDGTPQAQVSTHPAAGQFAVDYTAKTLTVGSDPTGQVRADDLSQAFVVMGTNVKMQGFGIRRYATSLPQMGTVYLGGAGDVMRNIVMEDSATEAISLGAQATVDHVTIHRSGMTGIHSNHASGSVITNSLIDGSDNEHFNAAPAGGAIKLSRSNNVTVANNQLSGNYSVPAVWLDENVIGFSVVNNTVTNNGTAPAGIQVELSGSGIVAGNKVDGDKIGLYIFDGSNVKVFNNEFSGNSTGSVFMSQDDRHVPGKGTAGASVQPSAANPWLIKNITISNNVFGSNGGTYGFQIYALDKRTNMPASSMNITIDGNLFHSKAAKTDTMVAWGQADNQSIVRYETPALLNSNLKKSWTNGQASGTPAVGQMGPAASAATAVPLPADVASAVGQPAGTRHVGRF